MGHEDGTPPHDVAWTCTPLPQIDERRIFLVTGGDITVRKQIPLKGSVRAQIEATLYNAFNELNYRAPATNWSGAGFGSISSVAPPRQIQLGFRVNF